MGTEAYRAAWCSHVGKVDPAKVKYLGFWVKRDSTAATSPSRIPSNNWRAMLVAKRSLPLTNCPKILSSRTAFTVSLNSTRQGSTCLHNACSRRGNCCRPTTTNGPPPKSNDCKNRLLGGPDWPIDYPLHAPAKCWTTGTSHLDKKQGHITVMTAKEWRFAN